MTGRKVKSNNCQKSPFDDVAISHGNEQGDLSTYSKFLCLYSRKQDTFELLSIQDKQGCHFDEHWEKITGILQERHPKSNKNGVAEYLIDLEECSKLTPFINVPIKISEYNKEGENQIRGVISTIEHENEFNDWFIFHILNNSQLTYSAEPIVESDIDYAEKFTRYFEENLKNTVHGDEWDSLDGRAYFKDCVSYFTTRYQRIECILPAFPCKSSNLNKVHSALPDKGEELAFARLITIIKEVRTLYPPGMKLWIVSDGHVFSDCIGVDDDVVDSYTTNLHALYSGMKEPGLDAIGFVGLKDLFFEGGTAEFFNPNWVTDTELPHYTGTKICPKSELSRQILMRGCDTENGRLRKQLAIPGHPRLHLFRGFSKFMTEDLSLLEFFDDYSRKGFKKVVAKVSFEMIKRNDAYSNLVELIFPHHMRLSIHAHTNSGPKFGIKIISPKQCKTIKSLDSEEEPIYEDFLHIPTPWHNCVVELKDTSRLFLVKSKVIKDAIDAGSYEGEWLKADINSGVGGHYLISKIQKVNKLN